MQKWWACLYSKQYRCSPISFLQKTRPVWGMPMPGYPKCFCWYWPLPDQLLLCFSRNRLVISSAASAVCASDKLDARAIDSSFTFSCAGVRSTILNGHSWWMIQAAFKWLQQRKGDGLCCFSRYTIIGKSCRIHTLGLLRWELPSHEIRDFLSKEDL